MDYHLLQRHLLLNDAPFNFLTTLPLTSAAEKIFKSLVLSVFLNTFPVAVRPVF